MIVCNCVLPQMTGRMCAACEAAARRLQEQFPPTTVYPLTVPWTVPPGYPITITVPFVPDAMRPEDV